MTSIPHGTTGGYANHRCRCHACRRAWAHYQLARRLRGQCSDCGQPVVAGGRRCQKHLAINAARNLAAYWAKKARSARTSAA